jgi:hypothetical protein
MLNISLWGLILTSLLLVADVLASMHAFGFFRKEKSHSEDDNYEHQ